MLSRQKKTIQMEQLAERLSRARGSFLVSCIGLNVERMTALRKDLKGGDGDIQVIRNTLAKIVLDKHPRLKEAYEPHLKGPNGFVLAFGEPSAAAKIIGEISEESEKFSIKCGVLDGKTLTAEDISVLAKLPPLPILRAQLLGALSAPMAKFLGTLEAAPASFVRLLAARAKQKGDAPGQPAEGKAQKS